MDEIKKEDVEKVTQGGFNSSDSGSSPYWLYLLMCLFIFNNKDGITKDEHIKMKEDIAELKGKVSMLEKMM